MNQMLKSKNDKASTYKELDKFLEEEFIPDYIQIIRKKDQKSKESYFPWIKSSDIEQLGLNEKELKYILKYLSNKSIHVSKCLKNCIDELGIYDCTIQWENKPLKQNDTIEKFLEYKKTKNKKIKDELIIENMRLVSYISFLISTKTGININELESYGYEGLIKSVNKFDPNRGYKFSSYAYPTIKGYILNGIREIRGYSNNNLYKEFSSAKRIIEKRHGIRLKENLDMFDYIIELLVEQGTITPDNISLVKNNILLHELESLDNYLSIEYMGMDNIDNYQEKSYDKQFLMDDNTLYLQVMTNQAKDSIEEVLNTLSEKKKITIKHLFGLEDNICYTELEVARKINVSRARVSAMKIAALRELRHPIRASKIIDYLEEFDKYNYEPNQMKLSLSRKK